MGATELWLVRHGESTANVAAARAQSTGADRIEVTERDADVPLSQSGQRQAEALGGWIAANMGADRPAAVWASSYLRAQQTIAIAMERAGLELRVRIDERLRDRELGILDLLTSHGVTALFPRSKPGANGWGASITGRLAANPGPTSRFACARFFATSTHTTTGNACWLPHTTL